MPSYVITGASKGLGVGHIHPPSSQVYRSPTKNKFCFLKQLSSDPSNTVIGFVRDVPATKAKIAQELPERKNIHFFHGDLTDYESLKTAFAETAKLTNGSLDVLIANAGSQLNLLALDPISIVINDPTALENDIITTLKVNAIGNIHLFNLALPLLLKSNIKKVLVLTSAMGDSEFIAEWEIDFAAPYAISKAALNMAVAKFHSEYKNDGILFMGVSPGVVDTSAFDWVPEKDQYKIAAMGAKFAGYAPDFRGPASVEESVAEKATMEKNGGKMVSHLGNRRWL